MKPVRGAWFLSQGRPIAEKACRGEHFLLWSRSKQPELLSYNARGHYGLGSHTLHVVPLSRYCLRTYGSGHMATRSRGGLLRSVGYIQQGSAGVQASIRRRWSPPCAVRRNWVKACTTPESDPRKMQGPGFDDLRTLFESQGRSTTRTRVSKQKLHLAVSQRSVWSLCPITV